MCKILSIVFVYICGRKSGLICISLVYICRQTSKSKKVTEVTFFDYISNPLLLNSSREESPSIMSKRSLCSMLYAPLSNFALSSLA